MLAAIFANLTLSTPTSSIDAGNGSSTKIERLEGGTSRMRHRCHFRSPRTHFFQPKLRKMSFRYRNISIREHDPSPSGAVPSHYLRGPCIAQRDPAARNASPPGWNDSPPDPSAANTKKSHGQPMSGLKEWPRRPTFEAPATATRPGSCHGQRHICRGLAPK